MSRYARQMQLPEVGSDGQARLAAAKVLVIGAGGLAAPVLPLLAGAGVGQLTIVDPDVVEIGNLHRQTLFAESDCGRPKAEAAARYCRALNAETTADALTQALTPANAPALVDAADLILDCADSYAASYTLSDACRDAARPLISASVLGLGGYVGGFCGGAPSLRAVFPDAPDSGASCATAGVLGPAVAMLGAMQAQMALAVLLGFDPSPLGRMVQFDARTLRSSGFRFDTAPEPPGGFRFVAAEQLTAADRIVDLRSAAEAPIPVHPLAERLGADDLAGCQGVRGGRLALCCATGLRAWRTAERLKPTWPDEIVLVAAATS
ncbi:Molybdopterin or thiamine biosynthesis adenylyltransferase [Cribrihabitans marinus]|uniref:Molybdopterin or thiamine biosynthesis adenylyltransferase n=1 Tax=Cribrihabitans marinus TaxID=1227549 RepID=A0A1H6YG20_9RHOB|nr:HesA/MoeB/ThiF family protein [Cribrihabitans marinus]GGH28823.1 hypothetical protein GCM10010973_17980 [Cribrihabitans marinus]SEJ37957.1 Molybdopterin or thiamine biosynthesis adenylyltransferase [Cribrihabitans marinus]